ncbi:GumC family protein [Pelagimonas varians]|uniref:non-specific protein-tyrosine kinase n=1 Tax=Pelagimonas varians TaxID=696760 RepID=A0A238L5I8_9RHOB|nr:polysaccharide biosynthesis tyrosine autokinase [Pelagimonas varians]PYG25486.1 capsular exopolysaccharide synthesis family protein [Pelagimonas varians]SMX50345.1 Tyrosine-protein kinase wzc [Pelagimonas varians]
MAKNPTSSGTGTNSYSEDIDILSLVSVLWRGKWLIGFCMTLTILLGGYQAFVAATPKYVAVATLALQPQNDQVVDIESVVSGASTDTSALNTELVVLRSRTLMRYLVKELNLTEDPEFNAALREPPKFSSGQLRTALREFILSSLGRPEESTTPNADAQLNATIENVRGSISVINQRSTYVFVIRAKTGSPAKSKLIANTLARLYIQDQIDVKFQTTENAINWLSTRVVELEAELEEKEDTLKQRASEIDVTTTEAVEALYQQVRNLRDRLAQAEVDVSGKRNQVAYLEDLRAAEDYDLMAAAVQNPALSRNLAAANNGDQNARRVFLTRFDQSIEQAQSALLRAESQAEALQISLDRLDTNVAQQADQFIALQQLERDTEATRTLYETFLTRLKETSVQRGLHHADSRILSEAIPGGYVEPRKSRILLLSAIMGFVIGAAIIFFRQVRNNKFRTAEDLEAVTGLATHGQIPKMPLRKRNALIPYLRENPTSAAAESIRNMRTSLLLTGGENTPQVILSTSSVPGEGKTTQAVALAYSCSGLGKKVLLIEGDLRRRSLDNYFSAPTGVIAGLTSAVAGDVPVQDCIFTDESTNVDILLGEKSPPVNAADFFSSLAFENFLAELRETYDFIIIDAPPLLVVTDARILARLTDRIMFLVAWDKTDQHQVEASMAQLNLIESNRISPVLSLVDVKGMQRYGYGGRYGAYASYGNKYYSS